MGSPQQSVEPIPAPGESGLNPGNGLARVRKFLPYVRWGTKDRIGAHYGIQISWRFSFDVVVGAWGWAGSLYIYRKRVWMRPIDYVAIDRLKGEANA